MSTERNLLRRLFSLSEPEPLRRTEEITTIHPSLSVVQKPKQIPTPKPPTPYRLPRHIEIIVLEKAERDGDLCPVSLEPLSPKTGIVTRCGHSFQKKGFIISHFVCPVCRTSLKN